MPIHIELLEPAGCLYYRFTGHITREDLDALRAAEEPYFDTLPNDQCCGLIADLSELDTIGPQLWLPLQQMRLVTDEQVCTVVVVGANAYLRALAISLGIVNYQREFIFRASVEEALAALGVSPAASD